jgi:hypothetical protein
VNGEDARPAINLASGIFLAAHHEAWRGALGDASHRP